MLIQAPIYGLLFRGDVITLQNPYGLPPVPNPSNDDKTRGLGTTTEKGLYQ
jgi:hypothetical protein